MLPCSQAQVEAKPVSASYSVVVNAPIDCLWSALDSPEAALYPGVLVRPLHLYSLESLSMFLQWLRLVSGHVSCGLLLQPCCAALRCMLCTATCRSEG